jgi:hypothetical protein
MGKRAGALLLVIMITVIAPVLAAGLVQIKGTRVSLVPPPGFTSADSFNGFQLKEKAASIVVIELPAPFESATAGFTSEGLASKGMTLLEQSTVTLGGRQALLLKVAQKASGKDFLKWIIATGTEDYTLIVNGTFPLEFEKELSVPVKSSLLSMHVANSMPAKGADTIRFSVRAAEPLKIAQTIMNSIMLTKNGEFPVKSPKDALVVVSRSLSSGLSIADKKDYSKKRAMRIEQLQEITIDSIREVTIDRLTGYEILAHGKDVKEGFETFVFQVMLFEKSDYFIIQGFVALEEKDSYLPVFRKIAQSFKRT